MLQRAMLALSGLWCACNSMNPGVRTTPMKLLTRTPRLAIVTALALGVAAGLARASTPDWNGFGSGSTKAGTGANAGRDVDTFSGYSTHLGWYTGSGSHVLNQATGA